MESAGSKGAALATAYEEGPFAVYPAALKREDVLMAVSSSMLVRSSSRLMPLVLLVSALAWSPAI
jgi:hypothetical protein